MEISIIGKMENILDHISSSKKDYTLYLDSSFTSFRYDRKLEELILDALARYIFNYIEKSKRPKEKCCSLLLVKQSNQPQAKISKILISVNDQQFNDDLISSNKEKFGQLLTNKFEKIFELNSKWFDDSKKKIIKHLDNPGLKKSLQDKRINDLNESNDFINTILDSIQNSETNLKLYDELLQFLRSIMDIYLITLFGSYYCLDKDTNNTDNTNNINVWDVPKKQNNASIQSDQYDFHSESKLAIYCACKYNRDYINEYVGISKLCCPLCANLLYQLKFKFRGSHSSFSTANKWRLLHSVIVENKDLDKIKEPLNRFSTGYLKSLKNELEQLKTIKKYKKKLDLNERIYNLTRLQSSDFIPDTYIFDYGQKFRNISLNDFKTLVTIIKETSEKLLLEDIESENYLLTEENVNDILTIIGLYERLMKKINIKVFQIFQVFYFYYLIML